MRVNVAGYRQKLHPQHIICALATGAVLVGVLCQGLPAAEEASGIESAKSLSRAFRSVAKKVMPTVVTVKTVTKARTLDDSDRGRAPRANPYRGTQANASGPDEHHRQ